MPYVDERAAEELFRHKVLGLLRRRGLLSPDRIELPLSWRRSGFSVHNPGPGSVNIGVLVNSGPWRRLVPRATRP